MLLAGHPQVPFYSLVIMASYALFFAATAPPHERRRALAGLVVIVAAGAAIAGVQLLPTAFALPDYFRDGGGTYEYFTIFSFPLTHLITLLFPRLLSMNFIEMPGYVGIAPIVLAIVGGLASRGVQDRHRRYFITVAAVSLFLVLGSYNPFYRLLHQLPLYNSFRIPSRNWFEFTLAIAVLTGLGVDSLRNGSERTQRYLRWALAGVGLTAIGTVAVTSFVVGGGLGGAVVTSRLPILAATLLVLGTAAIRHRAARSPAFGVVLALLVAADLFSFGGWIQWRYPPSAYSRLPDSLAFLEGQKGPYRILTLQAPERIEQFKEALAVNYNAAVGVESLGGYDIFMLRDTMVASAEVMRPYGVITNSRVFNMKRFRRFMDLLNTRYVLVPRANQQIEIDPTRYREVFRNDEVLIFENRQAFPRFFWVPQVRQADRVDALRALKSGRFDDEVFQPDRSALIEVPDGVPAPDPALAVSPETSGPGYHPDLELLQMEAGDARVRVGSRVAGLLIHSTNMSSGWTAAIDGAPAPVYRTNGFLQGVVVPAGSHIVRFRYWPVSFTLGAVTSLAGLTFVGCILAWPSLLRGAGSPEP
jgi:hypothetical protein